MAPQKLGETKGPLVVWIFVILIFAILILLGGSSGRSLPRDVTTSLIIGLLFNMAIPWGLVLVLLIVFVAFWERKRSLKEIFSSLGLRRTGSLKSVFWAFALTPMFILIYLLLMLLTYLLGPFSFQQAVGQSNGQIPLWYPYYMIIYSFFPVAFVEEMLARGYILDRLMPEHPSSLKKALPAIVVSSVLFTLYHLPAYLRVYSLSLPWAFALLVFNVFPWSITLSVAYVRARTRNILGSVVIHFLADSSTFIIMLLGMS